MWESTSQRAQSKLLTSSREATPSPGELDTEISTLHLLELSCVCHLENMDQSVGVRVEEGEHISLFCFWSFHCSMFIHRI